MYWTSFGPPARNMLILCDNMNRGARFRAESLERGKRDSKYRSLTVSFAGDLDFPNFPTGATVS